jgi:beta-xylosidase
MSKIGSKSVDFQDSLIIIPRLILEGNAVHKSSQKMVLSDANSVGFPIGAGKVLVATVGLLAPTIRFHKGTFFVICTNASHTPDRKGLITKNFYVTTKDIWSGDWSDPIFFDFKGIDTSLFFDDDDRAYIQGSWREGLLTETICTIRQFEVDIGTGKALSETKELWKGFSGKNDAEGPHIYKKDGYYFLVTAECGTFEHHAISVARSMDIWGPYESYAENPILTGQQSLPYLTYLTVPFANES